MIILYYYILKKTIGQRKFSNQESTLQRWNTARKIIKIVYIIVLRFYASRHHLKVCKLPALAYHSLYYATGERYQISNNNIF